MRTSAKPASLTVTDDAQMFLGHFGLALAAKRVIPGASLGTTVMAAQWADGVWPLLQANCGGCHNENDPPAGLNLLAEDAWVRLWHTAIHDRWGEIMNPLMEFNDEGIVDSSELREVFNLETQAR